MARARATKVRLRSAKGRPTASTRWLTRQLNDRFVQGARAEGYRSRAAYKLVEIDRRHHLLGRGRVVLDLGTAPGGFAQVAASKGCVVVGLDLQPVEPIAGVTLLEGDVLDDAAIERALAATGGPVDVLLSDLATPATGQRAVDRLRAEGVAEDVLALLPRLLRPGGTALIKLLHGVEGTIGAEARRAFAKVRLIRPEATRKDSSEIYLLGTGYRGTAPAETPRDQVGG